MTSATASTAPPVEMGQEHLELLRHGEIGPVADVLQQARPGDIVWFITSFMMLAVTADVSQRVIDFRLGELVQCLLERETRAAGQVQRPDPPRDQ